MESPDTLLETIQSPKWPRISAEIWNCLLHNGEIFKTKIGSKEYPDLIREQHFETKAQAIAHARVCIGF